MTMHGQITICNLPTVGTNLEKNIDQTQRNLDISDLSYETSNERLIYIFSQCGEIEEFFFAYEKNT